MAHEFIRDLHCSNSSSNVALKLDMNKTYDMVHWSVLLRVLRSVGFPEQWLDLVSRYIMHYWFSVLVNGAHSGLFPSTCGLRQGVPLSSSLFVLVADYLFNSLDKLFAANQDLKFRAYKWFLYLSPLFYGRYYHIHPG